MKVCSPFILSCAIVVTVFFIPGVDLASRSVSGSSIEQIAANDSLLAASQKGGDDIYNVLRTYRYPNSNVKTYSDIMQWASRYGRRDSNYMKLPERTSQDVAVLLEKTWSEGKARLLSSPLPDEASFHQGLFTDGSKAPSTCFADISSIIANVNQSWALQMVDALGKPEAGILRDLGSILLPIFIGNYDECMDVKPAENFGTQFCSALIGIVTIGPVDLTKTPLVFYEGLCVPDSCSAEEVGLYLNITLQTNPKTVLGGAPIVNCLERHIPLTTKAIVVICVVSLFVALMTLATAYDVLYVRWLARERSHSHSISLYNQAMDGGAMEGSSRHRATSSEYQTLIDPQVQKKLSESSNKPGLAGQLLLSFSVYTNTCKLLSTKQSSDSIECIHGIRFISMTWVILGHSFVMGLSTMENVKGYLDLSYGRWTFQAVMNALVSVDTFFALSGLLMSYLVLKELGKKGISGKFFGLYYFHRFWRLTPPYMLVMMTYVPLFKYISDGPIWPQGGIEIDECKDSWWTNLLYINNFVKMDKMCMGWSWYLANDMQFYIISPLLFLPLFYFGSVGLIAPLVGLLANAICAGVISYDYNLKPNLDIMHQDPNYNKLYYMKPYTRIGPYLVGIIAGYFLYKTECRARIPRIVVITGWMLATATALAVLYGLSDQTGDNENLSNEVGALYNALHRIAWGMAVCWVIFACANGYGGFVNTILSWKALVPLSKLTYCAYLVHILVIEFFFFSQRRRFYLDNVNVVFVFLGTLTLAYAVAYVASMAYEAPMMGLEKVLRGQGQKKEGTQNTTKRAYT